VGQSNQEGVNHFSLEMTFLCLFTVLKSELFQRQAVPGVKAPFLNIVLFFFMGCIK